MENIKMSVKAARVNFTNLTQLEVAKFLDISHTAYCRKENGKSRFYVDELAKIANLFNVPIDIFFDPECRNAT
ncbi:MAG: helix-turn-helix transcriptional regulator [Firmicutes bacterium]|nr:helix-turn-helix transcriptional regulator [Bacillota bacterium]